MQYLDKLQAARRGVGGWNLPGIIPVINGAYHAYVETRLL
jgi:hypothetical protein